jgi:hypothetical protein
MIPVFLQKFPEGGAVRGVICYDQHFHFGRSFDHRTRNIMLFLENPGPPLNVTFMLASIRGDGSTNVALFVIGLGLSMD